jgi:hypothetical protein
VSCSARARIFKKDSVAAAAAAELLRNIQALTVNGEITASASPEPVVAERLARGPVDGSIGFASRGRGRLPPGSPSSPTRSEASPGPGFRVGGSASTLPLRDSGAIGGEAALMDRMDPDFDRNYSKWNPQPVTVQIPVHPFYAVSNASYEHQQQQQIFQMRKQQQQEQQMHQHQHQQMQRTGSTAPGAPFQSPIHLFASVQRMSYQHHAGNGIIGGRNGAQMEVQPAYGDHQYQHQHQHNQHQHQHHQHQQQQAILRLHQQLPMHAHVQKSEEVVRPAMTIPQAVLQLPSHTRLPPSVQEQLEPVEPHVARSSGVLRPARSVSTPQAPIKPILPVYGLDSLADFPSLADGPSK